MPRCGLPARRAVSRRARADEKNSTLSVDRTLLGTSTIGPHPARSVPAVAPRDPPRSAVACRSAIGRPILRNATPQAFAPGSTEPHETTEPAATIQVAAGSSGITPGAKTGQAAGCRAKNQPAGAMNGPAGVKWRGQDSNLRPRGYEPRELPGCSTPRHLGVTSIIRISVPEKKGMLSDAADLPLRPLGTVENNAGPSSGNETRRHSESRAGFSRPSAGGQIDGCRRRISVDRRSRLVRRAPARAARSPADHTAAADSTTGGTFLLACGPRTD